MARTSVVCEEALVGGALITQLEQIGWNPAYALVLSVAFCTTDQGSVGLGPLFTIGFGYFATRSFQKDRSPKRAVGAHFLANAVPMTISILA